MFETVATVEDPAVARVLVTALKAHGFHPREGEAGLPGMPGVLVPRGGIAVELPVAEAADGRLLAEALVKDMLAR